MPTKSRPAALPPLSRQGPNLCLCKEWIDGGVFRARSIHRVQFFTNTRESLAFDICSHGIRIKLATRPATSLGESLSLFENRIRNRDRSLHELSITVVIPLPQSANSQANKDSQTRMPDTAYWGAAMRR